MTAARSRPAWPPGERCRPRCRHRRPGPAVHRPPAGADPEPGRPGPRQLRSRDSGRLAVHVPVRHSHHVAIGLTGYDIPRSQFITDLLGEPVRDPHPDADPDGILDHPVTSMAEIAPRYAVNRFCKRQRNGFR